MSGSTLARPGPATVLVTCALSAALVWPITPATAVVPPGDATSAATPALTPSASADGADPALSAATPTASRASDRVLVRFVAGATQEARAAALRDAGASAPELIEHTGFLRVTVSGDVGRAVRSLSANAAVADAQPVYRRRAADLVDAPARVAERTPSDPSYAKSQADDARLLRLPTAWSLRSDSSTIVAIVDTGVDLTHPDLRGRIVAGRDFVDNDATPQDENGHGTQVAGIVGAVPGNGRGIAGVVWNARIMPIRVLDADGYGFDDTIAKGIMWAADHGAGVINLSLGGPEADKVLQTAVRYATKRGALVVIAAGNDGTGVVQYPAAYSEAVAVGATDSTGRLTLFSSYGDWVDVAAPGWNVLSTALRFPGSGSYIAESGTSFSAPYVAGIAALVRAQHPRWSVAQVRRQLLTTARDAGAPGFDPFYGFGVVDAAAALGGTRGPRIPGGSIDGNDTPAHATRTFPAKQTIGSEGDVDWFRYRATGPTWARVRVSGATSYRDDGPTGLTPLVSVYDKQLRSMRGGSADDSGRPVLMDVWLPAAGDYFVSVRNQYPCRSAVPYFVDITPTATPRVDFLPVAAADFDAQSGGAAIGDVTGDGKQDIVLSSAASFGGPSFLTVVPGRNGPVSSERVYYDARFFWPGQGTIAIGDVDGDGRGDVVLGTDAGAQLFLQNAKGLLVDKGLIPGTKGGTVAVVPHPGGARVVAQAPDANGSPHGLAVFSLTGTRWEHVDLTTLAATEIEIGDVNNDKTPDIAVIDGSPTVRLFVADGEAYRTETVMPKSATGITGLEVADVTGDGADDIVTTADRYARTGSVTILRQAAAGQFLFAGTHSYPGGNGPVDAGDVNGDARRDIVITSTRSVVVFRVDAGGVPSAPSVVELSPTDVQTPPNGQAVGDLDGDGVDEVISRTSAFTYVMGHALPGRDIVAAHSPRDGAGRVGTDVVPTVTFGRAVLPATVTGDTVRLVNGRTKATVPTRLSFDVITRTLSLRPMSALAPGTPYTVVISGVRDNDRIRYASRFTFVTAG
ncbi:MAG: peptidase and in kexin sedolisin [Frankiales bacterium]|nr:peptidase and in kexin sedolisin [Frankiales bacterium]